MERNAGKHWKIETYRDSHCNAFKESEVKKQYK